MNIDRRILTLPVFAAILVLAAIAPFSRADTFVFSLHGGGTVEGDWVNAGERSAKTYLVATPGGGRVLLKREQVRDFARRSSAEAEYHRIAPTFADTVEEQWRLAEWCLERRLTSHREAHLERIIELDSEHRKARHGLGYTQVDGKWVSRDQKRRSDGYVRYRGKWRLAQEVEVMEVRGKRERAEREWMGKLKRWREMLYTDRSAEAERMIRQIEDPDAVRALREKMQAEPLRPVKLMYVEVLGQIKSDAAIKTLINASFLDPDIEIFHASVEQVAKSDSPLVLRAYIKGLKDPRNSLVNRSAMALETLGNPAAIDPLIDALVTTHQMVIGGASNSTSGTPVSTSFVSPGGQAGNVQGTPASANGNPFSGSGLSANDQPQVITRQIPNNQVLYALVKLSGGASFGFDKRAWENWLDLERSRSSGNLNLRDQP